MRTGVLVRASLIASKYCLASTVHLSVEYFFNMLLNSLISSTKFNDSALLFLIVSLGPYSKRKIVKHTIPRLLDKVLGVHLVFWARLLIVITMGKRT